MFFIAALTLSVCLAAYPVQANEAAKHPSPEQQECTRIGNKLGSVSIHDCLALKLTDSGARSVKDQAILLKEYPPLLDKRQPVGRVLLIGGTHGDEYAAVSIVFKWMKILQKYHSGLFHWHVVPLLNPDGLLLHSPSQRVNANGVDLNRNMPSNNWYHETAAYWKSIGNDPRHYPGSKPLSEPESHWLYDEISHFKPDVIITVHAPFGLLDFDGPQPGPKKIGYLNFKSIGIYPGSLGNCAGIQHDIPVITIELPRAGTMPTDKQISGMWVDLVRWMRSNIPNKATVKAYATFDKTTQTMMSSSPLGRAASTPPQPSSIQKINSTTVKPLQLQVDNQAIHE